MTTCDPSKTITEADIAKLKADMLLIDEVVESNEATATTPEGKIVDTLTGRLNKLGYEPPIAYAGGILFDTSDGVKTVDEGGVVYAPKLSELPFTTSGTWAGDDELKFYVVQGLTLYGGQVIIPKTSVADMISDASLQVGNIVMTEGYNFPGDAGGTFYEVGAAGAFGVEDGGYIIDLPTAGAQAKALFSLAEFSVANFGALGDGVTDDSAAVQAAANLLAFAGGGTLTFPLTVGGATFKCNFQLQGDVILQGASRKVTLIPAIDAPVVTLKPDATVERVNFRLLTIDGSATSGSFASQDGIRSAPQAGFIHSTTSLVDCYIKGCGATGFACIGGSTVGDTGRVHQPTLLRTTIEDCVGPGWAIRGNVILASSEGSTIRNNGSESVDNMSNVVIEADSPAFPEQVTLSSTRLDTSAYTVGGNAVAILGALNVTVQACIFTDFFTGIFVGPGPNGQIGVRDSRFDRPAGPITALMEVQNINGLTWDNNDVDPLTVGPVGISLTGAAADMVKMTVTANNSWGGLSLSIDDFPAAELNATQLELTRRSGTIPVNLTAAGASNLDNIYDENAGIAQLVGGDVVTLHSTDPARVITLKHGTGNIRLNGAADMVLDNIANAITLTWNSYLGAWTESSRSINHA